MRIVTALRAPTTQQAALAEAMRLRAERDVCRCGLCGPCFVRLRDAGYARVQIEMETTGEHNRRKGSY